MEDEIVFYEKYHVDKPKACTAQSQGVFEDMKKYYQEQLGSKRKITGISDDYSGEDCTIEQINVESMFNSENPYYTHNKIDINYDNI